MVKIHPHLRYEIYNQLYRSGFFVQVRVASTHVLASILRLTLFLPPFATSRVHYTLYNILNFISMHRNPAYEQKYMMEIMYVLLNSTQWR